MREWRQPKRVTGFLYKIGILGWQELRSDFHDQRTERERRGVSRENTDVRKLPFQVLSGRERGGFKKTH